MPDFLMVDPVSLFLPTGESSQGADPRNRARQIAQHGSAIDYMLRSKLLEVRMVIYGSMTV